MSLLHHDAAGTSYINNAHGGYLDWHRLCVCAARNN